MLHQQNTRDLVDATSDVIHRHLNDKALFSSRTTSESFDPLMRQILHQQSQCIGEIDETMNDVIEELKFLVTEAKGLNTRLAEATETIVKSLELIDSWLQKSSEGVVEGLDALLDIIDSLDIVDLKECVMLLMRHPQKCFLAPSLLAYSQLLALLPKYSRLVQWVDDRLEVEEQIRQLLFSENDTTDHLSEHMESEGFQDAVKRSAPIIDPRTPTMVSLSETGPRTTRTPAPIITINSLDPDLEFEDSDLSSSDESADQSITIFNDRLAAARTRISKAHQSLDDSQTDDRPFQASREQLLLSPSHNILDGVSFDDSLHSSTSSPVPLDPISLDLLNSSSRAIKSKRVVPGSLDQKVFRVLNELDNEVIHAARRSIDSPTRIERPRSANTLSSTTCSKREGSTGPEVVRNNTPRVIRRTPSAMQILDSPSHGAVDAEWYSVTLKSGATRDIFCRVVGTEVMVRVGGGWERLSAYLRNWVTRNRLGGHSPGGGNDGERSVGNSFVVSAGKAEEGDTSGGAFEISHLNQSGGESGSRSNVRVKMRHK